MRRLEFIWAQHLRDRPFVLEIGNLDGPERRVAENVTYIDGGHM